MGILLRVMGGGRKSRLAQHQGAGLQYEDGEGKLARVTGKSGMGSKLLTLVFPMWAGEQKEAQTLRKPSLELATGLKLPKKKF